MPTGCPYPTLIKNPHIKTGLKPGEESYIQVPCGKCYVCRRMRSKSWSVRLLHEASEHDSNVFVTLTYDDNNIPLGGNLCKKDFQDFMKRFRYFVKKPIKFFACGEYGSETWRPHYHAIIFGSDLRDEHWIKKAWTKGFISLGSVTSQSIEYVSGYCQKKLSDSKDYSGLVLPFQLQSQGLGLKFALAHENQIKRGITVNGLPRGIPRYYRKKLSIDSSSYVLKAQEIYNEKLDSLMEKLPLDCAQKQIDLEKIQKDINLKAKLSLSKGKI